MGAYLTVCKIEVKSGHDDLSDRLEVGYATAVWLYVVGILGVLIAAFGVGHRITRRSKGGAIDVGNLSDSWLAEQRGKRPDR
jgi:hypothetical protein